MKSVDSKSNPGLSKLPTEVRNKMGYMKKGGVAKKHDDAKMDKKTVKKAVGMHDKQMHGGKKTDLAKLKCGGTAKMAMGGMAKRYEAGGSTKPTTEKKEPIPSDIKDKMQDMKNQKAAENYQKNRKLACGGTTKMTKMTKMAKGGGIEKRGKTRGRKC